MRKASVLLVLLFFIPGCKNGVVGALSGYVAGNAAGTDGVDGTEGTDGINCWDLNGNHINDEEEDTNQDGEWTALDCQGQAGTDGEEGSPGSQGIPGTDGAAGSDGTNGVDGRDGTDGVGGHTHGNNGKGPK